jgi:multidrug efflux pump subunit AcrA (membrane-fusion protein)
MNKRQLLIVAAGIAILAISIILSGFLTKDKKKKEEIELLTAVKYSRKSPDKMVRTIRITGRLIPKQSVMLYAEVGGKAKFGTKPLKEGISFERGEVLLYINSDELQSNLSAKRSSFQSLLASVIPDLKLDFTESASDWEDYLFQIDTDKKLPPLPAVDDKKLKLFLSGRKVFSEYYSVAEMETRLEKHTIRAPFSGSITMAQIEEGSLVRVGQPLGEIISSGRYEMEAGVSYTDVSYLSVGTEFSIQDINTGREYQAKVVRINDRVDPQTQQVKIYAAIEDESAKSGIYLEGLIPAGEIQDAIVIPLDALVGENKVYFVEDSIARLKEVSVAFKNGENAFISGIEDTVDVIVDKHNEALNGTKVAPITLGE